MGRRRFFRYGELPLVLLALVERRPMSGYDLMGELGRLFGPGYRPSPGGVYPALKALHEEGLVTTLHGDAPATYAPTPAGHQILRQRRADLAAIERRTGRELLAGAELDRLLEEFKARVSATAERVGHQQIARELDRTVTRLERAARKPSPTKGET